MCVRIEFYTFKVKSVILENATTIPLLFLFFLKRKEGSGESLNSILSTRLFPSSKSNFPLVAVFPRCNLSYINFAKCADHSESFEFIRLRKELCFARQESIHVGTEEKDPTFFDLSKFIAAVNSNSFPSVTKIDGTPAFCFNFSSNNSFQTTRLIDVRYTHGSTHHRRTG